MTSDDLQLLREFRTGIPAPDEVTRRRIYGQATGRPTTRARGRRRRLTSVATAAAVAVAVAILLVSPWNGGNDGIVERALAAVGTGPVIHLVFEIPPSTAYVDLETGRAVDKTAREEMWLDQRNGRSQVIFSDTGRVVDDEVGTLDRLSAGEAGAVTKFNVALATGYRAALESGTAKVVGRGTFAGRRIYWLSLGLRNMPEVGIDAHTYKAVLLRYRWGRGYKYTRVALAKAIAYKAADFKRRGPAHPRPPVLKGKLVGFEAGSSDSGASHGTVVRRPWLTAGTTAAGLRLRAVTPFTVPESGKRFYYGAPKTPRVHGIALVYGPSALPTRINVYGPAAGRHVMTRGTTIYEFPRKRAFPWHSVPAGSIQIQSGLTTVGNRVVRTPWIGYLRKQGVFVTIRTPLGRRAVLQLARSLENGSG